MSNIEITPEVLRAVAQYMDERWYHSSAESLRTEMNILKRDEAHEKRIDELEMAFRTAAVSVCASDWVRIDGPNKAVRRGIRAILAHLEKDSSYTEGDMSDGSVRRWRRLEDVPVVVSVQDTRYRLWRHDESGWLVWDGEVGGFVQIENRNEFAPFMEVTQ